MFDFEKLLVSRIKCPDLLALHKPETSGHVVQFYEDDTFMIENVCYLAAKSLTAGIQACMLRRDRISSYQDKPV